MSKQPKQYNSRSIPAQKAQLNFNVSEDVLNKLKAIADIEVVSYTEIYNLAFQSFMEAYEKKHGRIAIKERGKGLKGL